MTLSRPPSPFPQLAAAVIRDALLEAPDYLEKPPVDTLWLRETVGGRVFDVVARPRASEPEPLQLESDVFDPAALSWRSK
jgi:hypothetical protein